ncbi:nonstructural protein [Microviridae sp.]|nr:nonstructural protein [Microviridae sp.]
MKTKAFAIYDSKTEAYLPPFFVEHAGSAIRSFTDACNKDDHEFGKHPEDYTLFELGEYDSDTGQMSPYDAKKSLITGIEVVTSKAIPGQLELA